MKHKQEKIGELILLGGVLLHSLFPIVANYGAKLIPAIQYYAYITFVAAVFFLVTTLLRGEMKQLFNKKALPYLLGLTVFIVLLPYPLIFFATQFTSGINTTLLIQSEALWATLICVFIGEALTKNRVLGVLCILLGSVFIFSDGGLGAVNWADLVLFFAPALFVFGNIFTKKAQEHVSWSVILLFRTAVGLPFLLLLAQGVEGLELPSAKMMLLIALVGVVLFGVSKILWQLALQRLDVSKTTSIGMTYPAYSLLWAFLFLGEIPNAYQWAGIVTMALGFFFIARTHSKQYEPLAELD